MRRVVVTGVGLRTPLTFAQVLEGESGVKTLVHGFPCARVVEDDDAETSHGSKFVRFALEAVQDALRDANWPPGDGRFDPTRTGVDIGSGIGESVSQVISANTALETRGIRRVSAYFVPRLLMNQAAGEVSMKHNFQGPNHCSVTACASGAHSIGISTRFIQFGDADVMVAGASESSIDPLSLGGFSRFKALSTKYKDTPEKASRPFDQGRDGFVMGEGAGILVLEELEHAKARNAKIYAEIVGFGMSGDAYSITRPPDDGRGAISCMKAAMKQAGLTVDDVDYINAHATSTPIGDEIENMAIATVFQGRDPKTVAVSSVKGSIGHLLGAAGAVEAAMTLLAMDQNVLPPTLNLDNPETGFEFNYVPHEAQMVPKIDVALSNSFGFFGTNTCLAFRKLLLD